MWIIILQRLLLDLVIDVFYAPLWWYTVGIKRAFLGAGRLVAAGNRNFAPGLWLRNMFVPMFGQTDFQGRMTSIFMRFVNVVGRSIALFFWILIVIGLFALWIVFPLFIVMMIIQTLFI